MHGNLEPEEKILPKETNESKEETPIVPRLDGYACPYPRRKLSILNE
tara:strand:- start:161 stop:301 length:141 start_codon:yes stop_codon:yes gene_type:complete